MHNHTHKHTLMEQLSKLCVYLFLNVDFKLNLYKFFNQGFHKSFSPIYIPLKKTLNLTPPQAHHQQMRESNLQWTKKL